MSSSVELFLAFDMGGTRLKAGLVSMRDGTPLSLEVESIGDKGFDLALRYISRIGRKLMQQGACKGVGLCVPGLVSEQQTVISLPGKLEGIVGFDLEGFLTSEFGLRPIVVNDAVAYGVGEAVFGAGSDYGRVVVTTIGTGVGVAVIDRGALISSGVYGGGILGGHVPIADVISGPVDSNGRPDTIEALCCAERIVGYANQFGDGKFESVSHVYEAHAGGDPAATLGIELYRHHFTRGMVALAHAHAPEAIVVGGGAITPDNPLTSGLEERVNERLFGSYRVAIRTARLENSAALCGLAYLYGSRSARHDNAHPDS